MSAVADQIETEGLGVVPVGEHRVGEKLTQDPLGGRRERLRVVGDVPVVERRKGGVEVIEGRIGQPEIGRASCRERVSTIV